ncbi:MAG: hypothetical protein QOI31_1218 [Solirubrobacterales bacterium]|jgi:hypothetical protein|nr:hypothetical protein [Solirubrobacterales bacterium]
MTIRRSLALLACAGLSSVPALAFAGDAGSRQEARYTLTEELAGQGTGEVFEFDYVNPDDPEGKPPAVEKVVTKLPRRGSYDASVPASCAASDAELMAAGADACPEKSLIGGGVVTVDTGLPGPARIVTADVVFANNADDPDGEFIYINTVRDGSLARTVIRADVRRRKTVTLAGMLPGTPPDGGSIDTVDLEIDSISKGKDNYITNPPRCRDGHWVTRVRFFYPDDVSQVERTRSPCTEIVPTRVGAG